MIDVRHQRNEPSLGGEGPLTLALLAIPNIITWVALFPGYFQADHQYAMGVFIRGELRQQHSLLWTMLAYPFIYLSPSYAIYGLVQISCFVLAAFFAIRKLKRLGVVKSRVPISAFFGLFPSFLIYNELYSSDMCFAYVLLYITVLMIELIETEGRIIGSTAYKAQLICSLALAICLRKNALIVVVALLAAVPVAIAQRRRIATATVACGLIVGLCVDSLAFPVLLHASPSRSQEMLSVPSTQIARVFAQGGDVPDDLCTLLDNRTADEWADVYLPFTSDYAKDGRQLTPEFIRDWVVLGLHNPKEYLYAYLELEYPFWTLGYVPNAQINIDFSAHDDFTLGPATGVARPEYLAQFNGEETKSALWKSVRNIPDILNSLHVPLLTDALNLLVIDRGLPMWTVFMGVCLSGKGRKRTFLFVACPVLALMLGFLAFAPVASMRYAMEAYYAIPLLWIYFFRRTSRWAVPSER